MTIVFAALATSHEDQRRTGLAIRNVTRQLRPLRSATIAINGTTQTFAPAIPTDQQAILHAIEGRELTHQADEATQARWREDTTARAALQGMG